MKRTLYIDKYEIDHRVRRLATLIDNDYKNLDERLCVIGVLRGAFIFMSDLTRLLHTRHQIDFISIGSYDRDKSGDIRLLMDTRTNVAGKHVLIIEDIIDSGKTIKYLSGLFEDKRVSSIKTCSLLRKNPDMDVDYLGFDIDKSNWLVGYGLDLDDKYRTLPSIYTVKPQQ